MNRRSFSLTEIIIAITILAVISVPIVNNLRTSKTQTRRVGKKLMAVMLAENLISYLQLYYSAKNVVLKDVPEEYFNDIEEMIDKTCMNMDSEIKKSVMSTYRTFIPLYRIKKDSDYPDRIARVTVEIYWKEASGDSEVTTSKGKSSNNRMLKYYGEIVK